MRWICIYQKFKSILTTYENQWNYYCTKYSVRWTGLWRFDNKHYCRNNNTSAQEALTRNFQYMRSLYPTKSLNMSIQIQSAIKNADAEHSTLISSQWYASSKPPPRENRRIQLPISTGPGTDHVKSTQFTYLRLGNLCPMDDGFWEPTRKD